MSRTTRVIDSLAVAAAVAAVAPGLVTLAGCGDASSTPDATTPESPPDAPLPHELPDLRFQWVGAFPTYAQRVRSNIAPRLRLSLQGELVWAPLELKALDTPPRAVGWFLTDFTPTVSIDTVESIAATGDDFDLDEPLTDFLANHYVITSLDIYPVGYGLIANRPIATPIHSALAYMGHSIDIDRAGLDAWVADEGQHGRVVTAISPTVDGTALRALSFERTGDTTVYEPQVADATYSTLAATATTLGAGGYIITAFGRNGDGPVLLIGTRVAGATTPRTITVQTTLPRLGDQGALVAWLGDYTPSAPPFTELVILER